MKYNFKYKKTYHICAECNCTISDSVSEYSINKYGIKLCFNHQKWVDKISENSTYYAIRLYFALLCKGIPAEIEKFDGFKHVDIAVSLAKIHIEVDGTHHNTNKTQALSDLKRTCYSLYKDYVTIRIPNVLTENNDTLEETAETLSNIIIDRLQKTDTIWWDRKLLNNTRSIK